MSAGTLRETFRILAGEQSPKLLTGKTALQSLKDAKVTRSSLMATYSSFSITPRDGLFTLPQTATRLIGVFHQGTPLDIMTIDELAAVDETWRKAVGKPQAVTLLDERELRFRVFPKPAEVGTLLAVFDNIADSPPDWLDLPLALAAIGMEMSHSNQKLDGEFSALCSRAASLMFTLVTG